MLQNMRAQHLRWHQWVSQNSSSIPFQQSSRTVELLSHLFLQALLMDSPFPAAYYFFSLPPPPFFLICAHYSTTVLFHTTHTWLCCRFLETQNATTPHLKLYNALHLESLESKVPYQSNTFLTHMNLDNTCSFELSFGLTGHIMGNSMAINYEIQCKSSTRKGKHRENTQSGSFWYFQLTIHDVLT